MNEWMDGQKSEIKGHLLFRPIKEHKYSILFYLREIHIS